MTRVASRRARVGRLRLEARLQRLERPHAPVGVHRDDLPVDHEAPRHLRERLDHLGEALGHPLEPAREHGHLAPSLVHLGADAVDLVLGHVTRGVDLAGDGLDRGREHVRDRAPDLDRGRVEASLPRRRRELARVGEHRRRRADRVGLEVERARDRALDHAAERSGAQAAEQDLEEVLGLERRRPLQDLLDQGPLVGGGREGVEQRSDLLELVARPVGVARYPREQERDGLARVAAPGAARAQHDAVPARGLDRGVDHLGPADADAPRIGGLQREPDREPRRRCERRALERREQLGERDLLAVARAGEAHPLEGRGEALHPIASSRVSMGATSSAPATSAWWVTRTWASTSPSPWVHTIWRAPVVFTVATRSS